MSSNRPSQFYSLVPYYLASEGDLNLNEVDIKNEDVSLLVSFLEQHSEIKNLNILKFDGLRFNKLKIS
jgi:hypothetical protein